MFSHPVPISFSLGIGTLFHQGDSLHTMGAIVLGL